VGAVGALGAPLKKLRSSREVGSNPTPSAKYPYLSENTAMITPLINTQGDSLIACMIPRATAKESEDLYKEVSEYLTHRFHPFLAQFLQNEKIVQKVHACKSIEELEKLDVPIIYPSLFSDLAEALDKEERLTDTERAFVLTQVADRMVKGAQDWLTGLGHQRAEVIANGDQAKKIVVPGLYTEEKKSKKNRIIT